MISDAINCSKGMTRYSRRRGTEGGMNNARMVNVVQEPRQLTGSRRQVLHGTNWQVQGSNGSNAAQLDQPWGSTLTFQHNVGMSCGTGLRHGVTMHPRGPHLREGMILLPHGTTHRMARKQQPPTTTKLPLQHDHDNWWRTRKRGIHGEGDKRPNNKHQDISSRWCYEELVSPARRQSGELYYSFKRTTLVNLDTKLSR